MYFFNPENYSFRIFIQIIGPFALLLICGLIIWYLSPIIASRILKTSDKDYRFKLSQNNIQDIAFSAIGLFIVVNTTPDIVHTICWVYAIAFHSVGDKSLVYITRGVQLLSLFIKLTLGIWLFIGSRGIGKLVRAMRRE